LIPRTKTCFVEVFEHLSEESRYKRFLRPIKHLTSKDLSYLTKVDHRDSEALVAVTPFGDPVGVARYIRTEERSSRAEVAVTVVDEWQQRGVGYALMRHAGQATATAHLRAAGRAARSLPGSDR